MGTDRHEKIQQRAYEIWEREGRPEGVHERHWRQAVDELERVEVDCNQFSESIPTNGKVSRARDKRRAAKGDVLAEEALAIKTGISGDEAERLIDKANGDLESAEQEARNKAGG